MTDAVGALPHAGWYDDPVDPASLRWWSGADWSDTVMPKPVEPPALPPSGPAYSGPVDALGDAAASSAGLSRRAQRALAETTSTDTDSGSPAEDGARLAPVTVLHPPAPAASPAPPRDEVAVAVEQVAERMPEQPEADGPAQSIPPALDFDALLTGRTPTPEATPASAPVAPTLPTVAPVGRPIASAPPPPVGLTTPTPSPAEPQPVPVAEPVPIAVTHPTIAAEPDAAPVAVPGPAPLAVAAAAPAPAPAIVLEAVPASAPADAPAEEPLAVPRPGTVGVPSPAALDLPPLPASLRPAGASGEGDAPPARTPAIEAPAARPVTPSAGPASTSAWWEGIAAGRVTTVSAVLLALTPLIGAAIIAGAIYVFVFAYELTHLLIAAGAMVLLLALAPVLAALDRRSLARNGWQAPAGAAWTLFGAPIYIAARQSRLRRLGGSTATVGALTAISLVLVIAGGMVGWMLYQPYLMTIPLLIQSRS